MPSGPSGENGVVSAADRGHSRNRFTLLRSGTKHRHTLHNFGIANDFRRVSWPSLGPMQDVENHHAPLRNAVDHNVWDSWNDQLTCVLKTAGSALVRLSTKAPGSVIDYSCYTIRRFEIVVLLNVLGDCSQIGDSMIRPFKTHQERSRRSNQARTSSSGTVSPRSTAARLLFTLPSTHSL